MSEIPDATATSITEDGDLNQAFTENPENDAEAEKANVTLLHMPIESPDAIIDQRPFNKIDDSKICVDGARQASITQLCSFQSIEWAKDILCMTADHPGHTVTMVS